MELSDHIIQEAHAILSRENYELPAQIMSAPAFYVAEKNDNTIWAFSAIRHGGEIFKIGTNKLRAYK